MWTVVRQKTKKTDRSAVCRALRCAGLGADVLDRDGPRAAGDAFASLRSRSLAAQVRVHVSTERDRLLLDRSCWSLDFFFNITKLVKLTHACSRVAHALRTEEYQCYFAHRRPHLRLCRQCGKRGAATPPSTPAAVFVRHADRAGTRQALDPRVDRSVVIACRRRAVRVLLACPAVLISSSQPCEPFSRPMRMSLYELV